MIDQAQASKLAKAAFESWQEGQLEKAALLYSDALALADPKHWNIPSYHGEYACVLSVLEKFGEAKVQLENSLAAELAPGHKEGSPGVVIARYFLATHLIEHDAAEAALDILSPSIQAAPSDWVTRMAQAQAYHALNQMPEAKSAAQCAIDNAPSQEKKDELQQYLGAVIEGTL